MTTNIRVVTTCHKQGFEDYGKRCLESWGNWPKNAELWWYTEGYELPETERVVQVPNTKIQSLQSFKLKFDYYLSPRYLFDVVRFSNKVYAAIDALSDFNGIGVWLDADCVTYKQIPDGFIESLLPSDRYIALFKRAGMFSETGFWVMNCAHPEHQAFLSYWQEWYDSGSFKQLGNWTDCEALDATIRKFEKHNLIRSISLSGGHEREMHPMALSDVGKYIDHCKGTRKKDGFSPENINREAVCEP